MMPWFSMHGQNCSFFFCDRFLSSFCWHTGAFRETICDTLSVCSTLPARKLTHGGCSSFLSFSPHVQLAGVESQTIQEVSIVPKEKKLAGSILPIFPFVFLPHIPWFAIDHVGCKSLRSYAPFSFTLARRCSTRVPLAFNLSCLCAFEVGIEQNTTTTPNRRPTDNKGKCAFFLNRAWGFGLIWQQPKGQMFLLRVNKPMRETTSNLRKIYELEQLAGKIPFGSHHISSHHDPPFFSLVTFWALCAVNPPQFLCCVLNQCHITPLLFNHLHVSFSHGLFYLFASRDLFFSCVQSRLFLPTLLFKQSMGNSSPSHITELD